MSFLPREHKIHIFEPPCNVLFIIWRPDIIEIADFYFLVFEKIEQVLQINKNFYYMDESVLLGTKPLVDSIRHSIRDSSGVFSYDTLASVLSPIDVTIRAISTLLNELGFLCRSGLL